MFTLRGCGGLEGTEIRLKNFKKSQSFAHFQVLLTEKNYIENLITVQINIAVTGKYFSRSFKVIIADKL